MPGGLLDGGLPPPTALCVVAWGDAPNEVGEYPTIKPYGANSGPGSLQKGQLTRDYWIQDRNGGGEG